MLAQATRAFAFTASALVVMTAAAIAGPAHAADADSQTRLVRYHDLDLNTGAGEAKLRLRIANAATAICGAANGPSVEDHSRFHACRDNAIASASSQMNAVIASARSSDHRYAMNNDAIAMLGR
jgi:UrcA family protein